MSIWDYFTQRPASAKAPQNVFEALGLGAPQASSTAQPIGQDELGRTIYRDSTGATYAMGSQPVQRTDAQRNDQALIDAGIFPPDPADPRASLNALATGLLSGFTAPGNALRGQPVTLGDVWETAGTAALGANAMPAPENALRAFNVYHASPHDFDKFSMDARGYGVGDQAFGDGHYFADTEAAGMGYLERVKKPAIDGRSIYASGLSDDAQELVWKFTQNNKSGTLKDVAELARADLAERQASIPYSSVREYSRIIDELSAAGDAKISVPGTMYEVNIDADVGDFLDWDAPSPQRPEVTAGDAFRAREAVVGRKKATAEVAAQGYPGITYGVGRGEKARRDFVVFDENLISIVRKYGIAGAAALYGATSADVQAAMAQEKQPTGLLGR